MDEYLPDKLAESIMMKIKVWYKNPSDSSFYSYIKVPAADGKVHSLFSSVDCDFVMIQRFISDTDSYKIYASRDRAVVNKVFSHAVNCYDKIRNSSTLISDLENFVNKS